MADKLAEQQEARTKRARQGRWSITPLVPENGTARWAVVNLNNGGHEYTVSSNGDFSCTCPDFQKRGQELRCKHIEAVRLWLAGEIQVVNNGNGNGPLPIRVTEDGQENGRGVLVEFSDGADIFLSIAGTRRCSRCRSIRCEHFRAAVPFFNRWKWARLESPDLPWGPTVIARLGVAPIAVLPDLVGSKGRWEPTPEAMDGVRLYRVRQGVVVHFSDGGHVYVSPGHPNGHTRCLGSAETCRAGECDHVARALAIAAALERGSVAADATVSPLARPPETGASGGNGNNGKAPGTQIHNRRILPCRGKTALSSTSRKSRRSPSSSG